MVAVKIISYV